MEKSPQSGSVVKGGSVAPSPGNGRKSAEPRARWHDPAAPPDPRFWLDYLHVARFPRLLRLLDDGAALLQAFDGHWSGPVETEVAAQVIHHHGDTPETHLNLVLLAAFMDKKKNEGLQEAARAVLPAPILSEHPAFVGRGHRLGAAGLVYLADPERLLDIELWDLWHPRRRCALKLRGQRRSPTFTFPGAAWRKVADAALDALGQEIDNLSFWRAFDRPWAGDAIIAFNEPGSWDTHRGPDGHIRSGHKDEWTFLRFHDDMHRVDVTARKLDRGISLASAMASRLWGVARTYDYARDPLSRDRLDGFLRRLCDPEDEVFVLHEITAEVPGRWRHPVIRVGNSGKERVEEVVQDLQDKYAYARASKTVHKAKVGFDCDDRHYRIELHFPFPDAGEKDMVLAYGDRGWSVDKATKFQELVLQQLGVEVHPKAPSGKAPVRPSRYPSRPKRKDVTYWHGLLLPHLDDPAGWQREALADLEVAGLVTCTDNAVFRCGDPDIPSHLRPDHTYDCPGEVVMPFGAVSETDPFRQEPGEEHPCSTCGHGWKLDGFQPPVVHRVTVKVDAAAAWKRVVELLTTRAWGFQEETPGVLARVSDGQRQCVVFPPVAGEDWKTLGRAAFYPVCWFDIDSGDVEMYGERGVSLAKVLADKGKPIRAALDRGPTGGVGAMPSAAAMPPVPYNAGPPPPRPEPLEADLSVRLVQPGDNGIYLGETMFADKNQQRLALLFALLQEVTEKEGARQPKLRGYYSAKALACLDPDQVVEEKDIHQWVRRARQALDSISPRNGLGKQVIESGGKKGIRIGPQFECRNFAVQVELDLYKESRPEP